MSRSKYDTPKRTCIVKTRLTEQERQDFEKKCQILSMSQSDVIRESIFHMCIKPIVIQQGQCSEETLEAVSRLLTACSRIGNNLNQLARYFHSGGNHSEGIHRELMNELTALTIFRLEAEKLIGETYGDHKAYQLQEL